MTRPFTGFPFVLWEGDVSQKCDGTRTAVDRHVRIVALSRTREVPDLVVEVVRRDSMGAEFWAPLDKDQIGHVTSAALWSLAGIVVEAP